MKVRRLAPTKREAILALGQVLALVLRERLSKDAGAMQTRLDFALIERGVQISFPLPDAPNRPAWTKSVPTTIRIAC